MIVIHKTSTGAITRADLIENVYRFAVGGNEEQGFCILARQTQQLDVIELGHFDTIEDAEKELIELAETYATGQGYYHIKEKLPF